MGVLRYTAAVLAGISLATSVKAEGFDLDKVGTQPTGWSCGVTGSGSPRWAVQPDVSAPSKPNVLLQSGVGSYPWCVRSGVSLRDGFVEVKFKPVGGREDQAGGLVWRWRDPDHYYVARANALENNVSLYYTEGGQRHTLKYADAPVPLGQWSALRVEFSGKRILVLLNGKVYIDIDDDHLANGGSVGIWTKADSITAFDDFSFGERQQGR